MGGPRTGQVALKQQERLLCLLSRGCQAGLSFQALRNCSHGWGPCSILTYSPSCRASWSSGLSDAPPCSLWCVWGRWTRGRRGAVRERQAHVVKAAAVAHPQLPPWAFLHTPVWKSAFEPVTLFSDARLSSIHITMRSIFIHLLITHSLINNNASINNLVMCSVFIRPV